MAAPAASTRGAAQRIADRFLALRGLGLDKIEAERAAFREFLADDTRALDLTHLYPEFVAAANPSGRRLHGIYYTPDALVRAQVRLVDDALRRYLGFAQGFGDSRVLIVDPATGSGSYPLAILDLFGDVRQRMRLFEVMPGAAIVARAQGLPVDESDVLSSDMAFDAQAVVCLGNPPYRRTATGRGVVDGFTAAAPGIHLKNLYNDYVYFWRWALRAVLETRVGAGVICFVTAASFLRGPAFVGMRRLMGRLLDDLWVIDLEGDHLAARVSDNVFPIRTPVAIALGVRAGATSLSEPAAVRYTRLSGEQQEKLAALDGVRGLDDLQWQMAAGRSFVAIRPSDHDYAAWPALTDLFPWQLSGAQLKRTWPIGPTSEVLRERWRQLLELNGDEQLHAFAPTRDRDLDTAPPDLLHSDARLAALRSLPSDAVCVDPVRYAYRSFDRQWVIPDARLGDFMRPALWRVAGPRQVFVTSLLTNVLGPGPAAVATAHVPDLDHFRGSFGARAVIPLWRDAAATQPNVSMDWLHRTSSALGLEVRPEALLAYCYALLATRAYVRRFEEELREPGPRVPITQDAELFGRCARVGLDLIELHTYRHVLQGEAKWLTAVGGRFPHAFAYDPSSGVLAIGDGEIAPVPAEVWQYRVSGYPVLRGWLRRRIGRKGKSPLDKIQPITWTHTMSEELLQLVWLVEMTLALEPRLDALLDEVVSGGCVQRPIVGWEELVGERLGAQRLREDEPLSLVTT